MNQKEWAKKEIELAKLIEYEDPKSVVRDTEAATFKARALIEIENAYTESVYDAALEVFDKLCDQNHSLMCSMLMSMIVTTSYLQLLQKTKRICLKLQELSLLLNKKLHVLLRELKPKSVKQKLYLLHFAENN